MALPLSLNMAPSRLPIRKTYKLFLNGNFARSESGRAEPARSRAGKALDNYSRASRKDFRDAVVAARAATAGWAGRSAYLRGQILYRASEMLEQRRKELAAEIQRSVERRGVDAQREVSVAIDRLVHYAGWTDKIAQIFGSVNPVATSHFNFTTPEPVGVVVIVCPELPSLLPLVTLLASVILSGNAAIALVSGRYPLPALTFAEILATSDLPPGVVNILAGPKEELAPHFASHMDVNAVVDASNDAGMAKTLQEGTATNLKRVFTRPLAEPEWLGEKAEDPYWALDTLELKTAWHPIGF